ncbi:dipeptidase [Deinococcus misasensis]|uniref:dipeptidase n=1 Tax=Deinococcus misasensis TaxID=392413 RepID=UPI000556AB79|nr:dipeptidase [Deinococcus misasensis]
MQFDQDLALQELFAFLRMPSVSADSAYKAGMEQAAAFLQNKLQALGFAARIDPTDGHPVVYAERLTAPGKPTVMIYGHYDVQPEAPLEEWKTPPFEPTVVDGRIYARGSTDDKGQLYAHVKGIETLLQQQGELPVNIKILFEGEEEIGSPNLAKYLEANKDNLKADVILISDGSRFSEDVPSITYGLRGLSYIEVHVQGANRDLHSGAYGGAVPNPINALCEIVAQLKDDKGRVTIPGFYDGVQELTPEERDMWAGLPFDQEKWGLSIGIDQFPGEEGYTVLERIWARPTLDVNGIWGGYQGEGSKTVIAAKAGAKISMRLVPGQDPKRITELALKHIPTLAPEGTQVEAVEHHGGDPFVVDLNSPYVKAANRALQKVYNRDAVFIRTGGSIPIAATFTRIVGAPILFVDMGLDIDAPHSPNESFAVQDYLNGILTSAYVLDELGKL